MVTRVLTKKSNLIEIREKYVALFARPNAYYANYKIRKVDAATLCNEIASGKGTVYKAPAAAVKYGDFDANDAAAIDRLIDAGFTVYVVGAKNYGTVKKLYEYLYT